MTKLAEEEHDDEEAKDGEGVKKARSATEDGTGGGNDESGDAADGGVYFFDGGDGEEVEVEDPDALTHAGEGGRAGRHGVGMGSLLVQNRRYYVRVTYAEDEEAAAGEVLVGHTAYSAMASDARAGAAYAPTRRWRPWQRERSAGGRGR